VPEITWEEILKTRPELAAEIMRKVGKGTRDCSTIFSIVPYDIREFKPGIYPGQFNIDKCLDENEPSRLFIPYPSKHAMMIGGKRDPVMIDTATYVLARSVVEDFLATQLYTTPDAKPGICWIQGDVSLLEFKTVYKEEYDQIRQNQKRWFMNVVKETDSEWVKSGKNIKVVSDIARHASKVLKLDKEWTMDDIIATTWLECPGCLTKNDPRAIVCQNCRCILNKEKYEALEFANR